MNAVRADREAAPVVAPRWLLLIHQLPPRPAYLRVRSARRLAALGAVALKNTVYALPRSESAQEDLTWVAREIAESGGEAIIVNASLVEGLADADVEELFQAARSGDYERIAERAAKLEGAMRRRPVLPPRAAVELRRLEAQLASAVAIDFFEAPGREVAEGRLEAIAARIRAVAQPEVAVVARSARPDLSTVSGRTWVTRRGVHVDRIACAWLIRRFIDLEARFEFVAPRGYRAKSGEIRFDMYDAEFTHEGDRCTFEVLLDESGLKDAGLRAVAEVVHDIDLKDAKFGRLEAPGVAQVLAGIARRTRDDHERLERGGQLFDDLYGAFPKRASSAP
jgi:hypothetical protein